jgi:hypothetical protein
VRCPRNRTTNTHYLARKLNLKKEIGRESATYNLNGKYEVTCNQEMVVLLPHDVMCACEVEVGCVHSLGGCVVSLCLMEGLLLVDRLVD